MDCAQRGFRLEEADLVRCVACPAALSGRLASSDVTGARERSVEALRKNLGRFPLPKLPFQPSKKFENCCIVFRILSLFEKA